MGEKSFCFSITGEFITQIARERYFLETTGYEKTMDILLSCMCGTDMSEKELKRHAEDVLLGRAAMKGNTADGTFHMELYNADEQPEVPDHFNVFKEFGRIKARLKETEEELQKMREWYGVAMEHVPSYERNDVLQETGQPIESEYKSSLLEGYMKRMMDEEEHTTEDYGWLAPDGTFHAVEWGDHQKWAQEYMEEHHPEAYEDDETDMQIKCNVGLIGAGDWLVEHGWVLLHSPAQGIAHPTRNLVGRYTKAQQEFLYDYYMERKCQKEANEVWEE